MSTNYEDDDFYGADDHNVNMFSNDAVRSQSNIFPIGYQDGLEDGKNETLQLGFNEGLKESSEIAYKWSLLIGLVSSIDVFYHHNKSILPQELLDTAHVLEDMQTRLKEILDQRCSPPTIDNLKSKFNTYNHVKSLTSTLTSTSTSVSTTNNDSCCKSNNNEDDDCCKQNETPKESDGCCGGSCTTTTEVKDISSLSLEDADSGCCGGSKGDQCCKVNNNNNSNNNNSNQSSPSPSLPQENSSNNNLTSEEDQQLFDQLCQEIKKIFNGFGLDGQSIVNQCLEKQFKVINSQN